VTRSPMSDESYRLYTDARNAIERGNSVEGVLLLRQSAALNPHFKTYELLGERLLAQGEHVEAVLYLAAAAGLGNKASRAHYLLAQAMLTLGPSWTVDAVQQLQRGLRLNPNFKAARALLEKLLAQDGDLRQWIEGT
jgi:hypothetical protein